MIGSAQSQCAANDTHRHLGTGWSTRPTIVFEVLLENLLQIARLLVADDFDRWVVKGEFSQLRSIAQEPEERPGRLDRGNSGDHLSARVRECHVTQFDRRKPPNRGTADFQRTIEIGRDLPRDAVPQRGLGQNGWCDCHNEQEEKKQTRQNLYAAATRH